MLTISYVGMYVIYTKILKGYIWYSIHKQCKILQYLHYLYIDCKMLCISREFLPKVGIKLLKISHFRILFFVSLLSHVAKGKM